MIYALDVVEELCVGDLALALDVSEDSVSYALRLLRTAGLIVTRKNGRVVYNRLADDFSAPLRDHCLRQLVALTNRADDLDSSNEVTEERPASAGLWKSRTGRPLTEAGSQARSTL